MLNLGSFGHPYRQTKMGKTMKHNILPLLLLLLSATGSLAQSNNDTAEVKAALDEFLAENAASSYNFFQNRLTPDFRYINPRGAISLRADVLKTHEADKSKGTKSEVSDLKIFRSGDLAVVSGIHNFSGWRTGFTYTMEKQKGNGAAPRWMFAASEHTPVQTATQLADEWPAMLQARNEDVKAFFQDRATPDMTFIAGHDGKVYNKDWLLNLLKNQKSHHTELTDVKIQQVGDLAIATGINTHTVEFLDGKKQSYKDAFTSTLRWIDGKWKFTNLHHTKIEYK